MPNHLGPARHAVSAEGARMYTRSNLRGHAIEADPAGPSSVRPRRRWLGGIAAISLLLTFLAGCGGSSAAQASPTNSPAPTQAPGAPEGALGGAHDCWLAGTTITGCRSAMTDAVLFGDSSGALSTCWFNEPLAPDHLLVCKPRLGGDALMLRAPLGADRVATATPPPTTTATPDGTATPAATG